LATPVPRPDHPPRTRIPEFRKFVKTARRYRTIQIQAGPHVITAADPLPDELRQALETINGTR
jgi:hypothetical protein